MNAVEHYEAALKEAFPSGATGDVFHHWNEARKLARPLTDEQIEELFAYGLCFEHYTKIVREIEAAHGIKEKNNG